MFKMLFLGLLQTRKKLISKAVYEESLFHEHAEVKNKKKKQKEKQLTIHTVHKIITSLHKKYENKCAIMLVQCRI